MSFQRPPKLFMIQKPMLRVCYALTPLALASVYFFGWRSLVLLAVVGLVGIVTEGLFTFQQKKPVTSAVFVTCLIYTLSLPPGMPFWMAGVGIAAGVAFGKMVFGGMGQNVFNPAMVGRCFAYVTFPVEMTSGWTAPLAGIPAGFSHWSLPADAVTMATPLVQLRHGNPVDWLHLFLGNTAGSLGETSALLILIGGAYVIWVKAAPWRLAASCLIGGVLASGVLHLAGVAAVPSPLSTLLAGSFLFGSFFIVTEPVTGPKTRPGQWAYGLAVGALIVLLRGYSNFSEGVMFSVLVMNAFVPLLDQTVRWRQAAKKAVK